MTVFALCTSPTVRCEVLWSARLSVRLSQCHMFVCSSVRLHISKITRPNFTKFSLHVTVVVARSSSDGNAIRYVLPVLWMTFMFSYNGGNSPNHRRRVCLSSSPGGGHKICRHRLHLVINALSTDPKTLCSSDATSFCTAGYTRCLQITKHELDGCIVWNVYNTVFGSKSACRGCHALIPKFWWNFYPPRLVHFPTQLHQRLRLEFVRYTNFVIIIMKPCQTVIGVRFFDSRCIASICYVWQTLSSIQYTVYSITIANHAACHTNIPWGNRRHGCLNIS